MRTIWKIPLVLNDFQTISVPAGCEYLTVQDQRGVLCLWAIVDDEAAKVSRSIRIVGTGHATAHSQNENTYIGTVQQNGFVWHVFSD